MSLEPSLEPQGRAKKSAEKWAWSAINQREAQGRCWWPWSHRWTVWEKIVYRLRATVLRTSQTYDAGLEIRQKRECLDCGVTQERKID